MSKIKIGKAKFNSEDISFENAGNKTTISFENPTANRAIFIKDKDGNLSFDNENIIVVDSLADLPEPVNGVITINNGKLYFFARMIDASSVTINVHNATLDGISQELSGLLYTTINILGTSTLRNIRFDECQMNINAPQGAFDWSVVNFYDCLGIDIIAADNIVWQTFGFINTPNVQISGVVNSVIIAPNCIWRSAINETASLFVIKSTAVINRRIRVQDSVISTSFAGQKGLVVEAGAVINDESLIFKTVRFIGPGTALTGINGDDNRTSFFECVGGNVINSTAIAKMFLKNNVVETVVTTVDVRYKVQGTFELGTDVQRFSFDGANNALEYTSSTPRTFFITMPFSVLPSVGNNINVGTYIGLKRAENPAFDSDVDRLSSSELYLTTSNDRPQSGTCVDVVTLYQGDKLYTIGQNRTNNTNLIYQFISIIPIKSN